MSEVKLLPMLSGLRPEGWSAPKPVGSPPAPEPEKKTKPEVSPSGRFYNTKRYKRQLLDRAAQAARMYEGGMSIDDIAEELGRTRMQIIGDLDRHRKARGDGA